MIRTSILFTLRKTGQRCSFAADNTFTLREALRAAQRERRRGELAWIEDFDKPASRLPRVSELLHTA